VTHLALAVGHRRRNAVGVQAHAAHAETGAGAEAARADLQVLRVVVAVGDDEARHARHRFGEIDHRSGGAQRGRIDGADGIRRVLRIALGDGSGDDDRLGGG
jgi:hypothetical protein